MDPISPYHITARSHNQDWLYLPMPEVWQIFGEKIRKITQCYSLRFHAFVLMSNHFHALASAPLGNIDEALLQFLGEVEEPVNRTTEYKNRFLGGPYAWSRISNPFYYGLAYKYVFRNPVKAGIVPMVEQYPYSTIRIDFFSEPSLFPLSSSRYDFQLPFGSNLKARLEWLNRPFALEETESLESVLRQNKLRRCEKIGFVESHAEKDFGKDAGKKVNRRLISFRRHLASRDINSFGFAGIEIST